MLPLVSYQTFKSIKDTSWKNKKADKNMVNNLDYEGINFPVSRKDFGNIEKKNNVWIIVFLVEHKETYLKINGKQTVKLRCGSIKFKNHLKELALPFKIYPDFECNMKRVVTEIIIIIIIIIIHHTLKNIKRTFLANCS